MTLLPQLPPDFPVPIVIVQHMPALFTRLLAERLNVRGPLKVQEGRAGERLLAGQVWIAPGDRHMTVFRKGTERFNWRQSGSAGKFMPSGGRCALPLGSANLQSERAGDCSHWHGRRWHAGMPR